MKRISQHLERLNQAEAETIATFGEAKLVKTLNGKYELRGGSPHDRVQAREWISLFMHNAVVKEV
jgi:hypothetical protein